MGVHPLAVLEVAFTTDPLDPAPVWVDLSDRLMSVYCRRGRPDAYAAGQAIPSRFEAGELALTLRNGDRALDPSNPASPYAPNIAPGRRIRLRYRWGNAAPNPSFEAGALGATPTGWTLTGGAGFVEQGRTAAAGAAHGGFVHQTTEQTAAAGTNRGLRSGTTVVAASPGQLWGASSRARALDAAAGTSQVVLRFLDAAGVQVGASAVGAVPIAAVGAWTAATASMVAPAGTAFVEVQARVLASGVAGRRYQLDAVMLEPGGPSPLFTDHPATTFDRFDGFVRTWPPDWQGRTVALTALDHLASEAVAGLPASVHEGTVRALGPAAWLRLGDRGGVAQLTDSSGNGRHASLAGTLEARDSLHPYDPDPAGGFTGLQFARLPRWERDATGSAELTVAFLIAAPPPGIASQYLMRWPRELELPADNVGPFLQLLPAPNLGQLAVAIREAGPAGLGDEWSARTSVAVANDAPHLVVVRFRGDTMTGSIRVDGVDRTTGVFVTAGPIAAIANIEAPIDIAQFDTTGADRFVGTLDELAIFDRYLTDAEVADVEGAYLAPWDGDLPGARIDRMLDLAGIPAALRDIDPGASRLQAQTDLGGKVLERVGDIVDAEQGAYYVTRSGVIRFRERHAALRSEATAIAATFGDDPATPAELPYEQLGAEYTLDRVVNVARFGRRGGTPLEARDAGSVARNQESSVEATDLPLADELEVADAAAWRITRAPDPEVEFRSLTVPIVGHPDITWQALTLDLEQRVRVLKTPPGGGARLDSVATIQQVEDVWEPEAFRVTYQLAPADTRAYLVLDDPVAGFVGNLLAY